ncbi:hypothetical protein RCL1_000411 [Eukaryota sp. TZLM3-RCL]
MRQHLLPIFILLIVLASGQITSGTIEKKDTSNKGLFIYLEKFAYSSADGILSLDVQNHGDPFKLLIFSDEKWQDAYKDSRLLCIERTSKAIRSIHVTKTNPFFEQRPISFTKAIRRPTFIYVALANCNAESEISASYTLTFTNPGNWWREHLSADLHGLGAWSLFLFIIGTLLLSVQLYAVFTKWGVSYLHPLIKLLTAAIFSFCCSVVFFFIYFARMASNGSSSWSWHFIADLFMLTTDLLIMTLLVLVSKGWAVSTTLLTGKRKLFTLLTGFVVVEMILLLLELTVDEALHTFIYDNVFGYLSVCLRVAAMFYFLVNLQETRASESFVEKRRLYDRGGLLFVFWFMFAPVIIFGGSFIPAYDQEKIVDGCLWAANLLSLFVVAFVLWPSRAQRYFKISTPDVFSLFNQFD